MSNLDQVIAVDIAGTMSTPGWRRIVVIFEEIVREAEEAALRCEEEDKLVRFQRKAQAARETYNNLMRRLESATRVEASDFEPISY